MKPRFPLFLALLALASLTCQAVSRVALPQPRSQSIDPAALARAGARLTVLLEQEKEYGELYDLDTDQNGAFDEVIYHFPPRPLETDVRLQTNLIYSSGETASVPQPGIYYKAYLLFPENLSGQEKQVRFTFEIPKYFARSVDELSFQPQPSRIVNPDPVVLYDMTLPAQSARNAFHLAAPSQLLQEQEAQAIYIGSTIGDPIVSYIIAKERLRANALAEMREACKAVPPELKSICYLSMVADFKDIIGKGEMEQICIGEVTGYERRLCLSLARDSAAECDSLSAEEDIFACKGFYVRQKCKGLDGGELQACLRDTSISSKAPLGCADLQDPDIRNDCFARAGGDASYCKQINNTARREACEKALRAAVPSGPISIDPGGWFTMENAAGECRPFYALFPEYKAGMSTGFDYDGVGTLSCAMDASDPGLDDVLSEVSIQIWADPSIEVARQKWADETDGYSYAGKKHQEQTNTNPDLTFTFGADTYFTVLKRPSLSGPPIYTMAGGSLYQNGRIAFNFDAYASSPARWQQVEAVFKQLIDRMLR